MKSINLIDFRFVLRIKLIRKEIDQEMNEYENRSVVSSVFFLIYFMIDLNHYKNEMLLKVVFEKSIEIRFLFIGIFESVFLFLYQQK